MGWLDFLFRPPSRDQFAELVLARLRQCAPSLALKYNPAQFLIERGSDGFINLANIYYEYCQAGRNERQKVLHRFIRGCVGTAGFELPEDFSDVHPDLLPVVRSRFYFESVALQSRIRGGEGVVLPQQMIGDHLSLSLVYDLPQAMRSITQEDLDRWGVTLYEAIEAACENLGQMGNASFAGLQNEGGEGVFISATGDNYDASRLVLLDLIRKFPVRGDYIAMVPNRDTLIVTGSEDSVGLEILCKIAADSLGKPRPISTVALRLAGDEWESWLPPPDARSFAALNELRLRTVGMEYNDQKELLDRIHEATGEDIFVASFNALQHKETNRVSSYSVWSAGVPTLLPETDQIVLLRHDAKAGKMELAAMGSFQRVREVAGDLMEPLGTYPERYRVLEFPSRRQLDEIGKGDWAGPNEPPNCQD